MTQSKYVSPQNMPPTAGYSHVVITPTAGQYIQISGQVGLNETGTLVGGGDFERQAEQAFENLGRALRAAGADFKHLIKINMFLTDIANLTALRAVRDRYLDPSALPASTLLEVKGFFRPDLLFELDGLAFIDH